MKLAHALTTIVNLRAGLAELRQLQPSPRALEILDEFEDALSDQGPGSQWRDPDKALAIRERRWGKGKTERPVIVTWRAGDTASEMPLSEAAKLFGCSPASLALTMYKNPLKRATKVIDDDIVEVFFATGRHAVRIEDKLR